MKQKLKCAILDDYQNAALTMADWSKLEDRVEVKAYREQLADEDDVVRNIKDCEIVVIMRERTPFRASLLSRLPKLKLLVTTGMRNASIDLKAAAELGITVCGTGSRTEPPVELTWALILGLARKVAAENEAMRTNGPWQSTIGTDLYGKRLGLLGLGKIGGKVARIGQAFGMEVAAWSQNLTRERADAAGAVLASSKEELLQSSDIVSIHLVLSERTRHLIGARELELMKPTAYLINTSRAGIVDQAALLQALRNGRIAGAGLDVYEREPLPHNDPLRTLPNVLALPHLGYVTEGNYGVYFREALENIEVFLLGEPIRKLQS
ncbi:D-2-hydroxyacid dehydrogenase family protein [Paenibacillus thermotolerans]|uniref:D-2-hydroxyacid dehydrogenase family protein n=1 Tax=Paenibacillus thermotolerans TaxID=3027807 RepID=UPI0023674B78|nr:MULTISPECIES: D-2-hydroxyacid dehydrogenase family protein [unclassified Paenibacillus]